MHPMMDYARRMYEVSRQIQHSATPRGSIVLDGPSALRSLEPIQVLQATPTCCVMCHVTQLLMCCTYQVTAFRKFLKKNGREQGLSEMWTSRWEQCPDTDLPELWKRYFHNALATWTHPSTRVAWSHGHLWSYGRPYVSKLAMTTLCKKWVKMVQVMVTDIRIFTHRNS